MIYIGTSGYSFRDWVGPFYPRGTASGRMLEFYARKFPAVEINSTYYRLPPPETLAKMSARTPDRFRFTVKLHKAVTHEQTRDPAAFTEFLRVVQPLRDSKKFFGALAQFPYGFKNDRGNQEYIAWVRERLAGIPIFVEFRHSSWARRPVLDLLERVGAGFCTVDEPSLPGLFPSWAGLTGEVGYFRFHGRNRENWWTGDASRRYDYLYDEEELAAWARKIRDVAGRARETFVFFNNCHGGSAAKNASQMTMLLTQLDDLSRSDQEMGVGI